MTPKNEPITHRADDDGAALYFVRAFPTQLRLEAPCTWMSCNGFQILVTKEFTWLAQTLGRHEAAACYKAADMLAAYSLIRFHVRTVR